MQRQLKTIFLALCFVVLAFLPAPVFAQDGYPQIGLLFANSANNLTPEQAARYDLIVDGNLFQRLGDKKMAVVRQLNPHFVGLSSETAVYTNYDSLILNDPRFQEAFLAHVANGAACNAGSRVKFPGWNYPIYVWNLTREGAANFLADFIIERYRYYEANHPDWYDGIAIDGAHLDPPWFGWYPNAAFDLDCDGDVDSFDSPEYASVAWRKNLVTSIQRIRQAFPGIVIIGNDSVGYAESAEILGSSLNGVELELGVTHYLDNVPHLRWCQDIYTPVKEWHQKAISPQINLVMAHYSGKAIFDPTQAQIEAGRTAYRRMRFGLVTALLTDAVYLYDLGTAYNAQSSYWYDEYDNGGAAAPGYLGMPAGDAFMLDQLETPNLVANGSFEVAAEREACGNGERPGVADWCEEDHLGAGAMVQDCTTAYGGDCSLRIAMQQNAPVEHYQFQLRQNNLELVDDTVYTLSFWARAEQPRPLSFQITRDIDPWTSYSAFETVQLSREWQQFTYSLHTRVPAGGPPLAPETTRLVLYLGRGVPTVWLDDVLLQKGAAGIYRRDFENGIVLANSTELTKTVKLEQPFRHIRGSQETGVNNGLLVSDVQIPAKDGVILLRLPPVLAPRMWLPLALR